MRNRILAGLVALGISAAVFAIPAEARCEDSDHCGYTRAKAHKGHGFGKTAHRSHSHGRSGAARHPEVVAMIKSMAPSYGVPTWFALRIAKIESGYNPRARGAAGELGVFQMKCATARGIGYHGSCSGLLNTSTGVRYGLKHLSIAVRSSRGNLKLAASKHNGGLGRKSLVRRYVRLVF